MAKRSDVEIIRLLLDLTSGFNNLAEFLAGTDPQDAGSNLRFVGIQLDDSNFRLDWIGGTSAVQIIDQLTPAPGDNWRALWTNQPPTPITNSLNLAPPTNPATLYRLRVREP